MIDAARDFDLIEIEGDAAFMSRRVDGLGPDAAVAATTQAVVSMHRAFHVERRHVAANLCPCDGCEQAENLKLKFVAHIGEVATQSVHRRRTLVGIDVILVHRLLKNPVEIPEYVLLSEQLYRSGGPRSPIPSARSPTISRESGRFERTSWTSGTSRALPRRSRIPPCSYGSATRSDWSAVGCHTCWGCVGAPPRCSGRALYRRTPSSSPARIASSSPSRPATTSSIVVWLSALPLTVETNASRSSS